MTLRDDITLEEAIKVMENEQRCVIRNIGNHCDRTCTRCDLVLPDGDVLGAYGMVLSILQELKEAKQD